MTGIRAMVDAVIGGAMNIPGAKPVGRAMTKYVTRSPLIKRKDRQRVYNLLGVKTIPSEHVDTRVAIPGHPDLELNVRLGLEDELSRLWYYFGYDHYEVPVRQTLAALFEALPTGRRWHVLNVGGNIGYFSLFLGSLAKDASRARIHAFEPSPRVFNLLQRNLALNPGLPVTLNEAAVSDIAGETKALAGFANTLERDSPHVVLEILPRYPQMTAELAALPFFSRYRKFLITDAGLIEHAEIRPNYHNRDWLLSVDPPIGMVRSSFG